METETGECLLWPSDHRSLCYFTHIYYQFAFSMSCLRIRAHSLFFEWSSWQWDMVCATCHLSLLVYMERKWELRSLLFRETLKHQTHSLFYYSWLVSIPRPDFEGGYRMGSAAAEVMKRLRATEVSCILTYNWNLHFLTNVTWLLIVAATTL